MKFRDYSKDSGLLHHGATSVKRPGRQGPPSGLHLPQQAPIPCARRSDDTEALSTCLARSAVDQTDARRPDLLRWQFVGAVVGGFLGTVLGFGNISGLDLPQHGLGSRRRARGAANYGVTRSAEPDHDGLRYANPDLQSVFINAGAQEVRTRPLRRDSQTWVKGSQAA